MAAIVRGEQSLEHRQTSTFWLIPVSPLLFLFSHYNRMINIQDRKRTPFAYLGCSSSIIAITWRTVLVHRPYTVKQPITRRHCHVRRVRILECWSPSGGIDEPVGYILSSRYRYLRLLTRTFILILCGILGMWVLGFCSKDCVEV